jgi:RNA polymerase sigma-70 factor (ECF subfamily)
MLISLPPIDDLNDRQFMSELYERYRRIMYSKAMEHLADPQDADDLIQDCLEKLIKNVSTLRSLDDCALISYIVATVRNTAINLSKHLKVESRHVYLTDFEDEDPADFATLPEDILLSNEFSNAFAKVFDTLSEDDQLLLRGKYVLEMEDEELADIFGCAPNSIRMKLTRARRRAVKCLLEGEYFSEQT